MDDFEKNRYENLKKNAEVLLKKIKSADKSTDRYLAYSCIFGAFLGDSLGSYTEFSSAGDDNYKEIYSNPKIPPGYITDDSEMALGLGFSIMDSPNIHELDSNLIYYYYGMWNNTDPYTIGGNTKKALALFNIGSYYINENSTFSDSESYYTNDDSTPFGIQKEIQKRCSISLANGFIMRISPVIVWYYYLHKKDVLECVNSKNEKNLYELYLKIKEQTKRDSITTHPNPETFVVGGVFVFMGLCAMSRLTAKEIIENLEMLLRYQEFRDGEYEKIVYEKISSSLEAFRVKDKDSLKQMGDAISSNHMGYYLNAINLTLYFLIILPEKQEQKSTTIYRQIVEEISNLGGDTDTNAAIVGTIIGPILGFDHFGKDLDILLKFVSKTRFMYCSTMIYYFVEFLEEEKAKPETTTTQYEANKKIRFNYFRRLYGLLYKELS